MESESGAKIAIRGKGSVKEGKGASDRATDSNLDEDLHCLIIADTETKVELAKRAILEVIETVCFNFPGETLRLQGFRLHLFPRDKTRSKEINFESWLP